MLIATTNIASYLDTTFTEGEIPRVAALIDSTLVDAGGIVGYPLSHAERIAFFAGSQRRVWLPVPALALDTEANIIVTIYDDVAATYSPWTLQSLPVLRSDASLDLYGAGSGPDAVQVTYTAGWTDETLPKDLKQALIELIAAKWSLATNVSTAFSDSSTTDAPVKTVSIGSFRTEYAGGADTTGVTAKLQAQASTARDTIARYRRVGVF